MKSFFRSVAIAACALAFSAGVPKAADIVLVGGQAQFLPGPRLFDGTDLNSILDRVNALSDGTWEFTGPLLPDTANTYAIGSATLTWADVFLGSGAVINFDNGDVTITHAANALTFAGGAYTLTGNTTVTGTMGVTGATTVTSASASSLAVGLAGATNPAFVVDSSTGSQAAGLSVTGATAAGTVAVASISSGAAASLSVNAKGTGTIAIGNVSTGAVTITPATTVTGIITPTGGVAAAGGFSASPRTIAVGGLVPAVSTDFTDATPVNTEVYIGEVFVPANMTITGIAVFNGTNVTDNIKVGLTNSAGAVVAESASTAGSGTDAYQRVPFTAPYAAKGPATYYVLGSYAAGTSRYNAPPLGSFGCSVQTGQVFGTFTTITPPTTFTTNVCNIASLY